MFWAKLATIVKKLQKDFIVAKVFGALLIALASINYLKVVTRKKA